MPLLLLPAVTLPAMCRRWPRPLGKDSGPVIPLPFLGGLAPLAAGPWRQESVRPWWRPASHPLARRAAAGQLLLQSPAFGAPWPGRYLAHLGRSAAPPGHAHAYARGFPMQGARCFGRPLQDRPVVLAVGSWPAIDLTRPCPMVCLSPAAAPRTDAAVPAGFAPLPALSARCVSRMKPHGAGYRPGSGGW